MSIFSYLIPAAVDLIGSSLAGNAQQSAGQDAANSQMALQEQAQQKLAQQGADYRAQINQLAPYTQSAIQAATQYRNGIKPLLAGQNTATFGGQAIPTSTGAPQYGSPPMQQQQMPYIGGNPAAAMPPNGWLAQRMQQQPMPGIPPQQNSIQDGGQLARIMGWRP
jgi:hypothetical protein